MYRSTKIIDGFSTCFRQFKAEQTHCKYLHGYSINFKLVFEAQTLDDKNWVMDFGFAKRSETLIPFYNGFKEEEGRGNVKDFFDYMFDHTVIISEDDPYKEHFINLHNENVIQLRILSAVGCEKFAEYIFNIISSFLEIETKGRVKLISVECKEHEKNSAIYYK